MPTQRKRALRKDTSKTSTKANQTKHSSDGKALPEGRQPEIDMVEFSENMLKASQLWQIILGKLSIGYLENPQIGMGHADPLNVSETLMRAATHMAANPFMFYEAQCGLVKDHMNLWHQTTQTLLGKDTHSEEIKDRRFKNDAWNQNSYYDYLRRSYLLNSNWMQQMVKRVPGLDEHTARKVEFFTRQMIDALSPSNYVMTNPEVLQLTLESHGANLVKGLQNMLEDIDRGHGKLRISMTDDDAFTLGENIACTPGKVVYENDLMQLIQYTPTTKQVHEYPLLIVPAWINKYYVLDLRPENSWVKWLVDQGYTVFMISWVNPDESLRNKEFQDYLREGPLAALDVIETITGADKTNLIGYCLGGTLVAITLSYLRTHQQAQRIGCASYLTTMVDFTDAGELSVFIDDEQIESLEERMAGKGYLEGNDMATTFSMLRANDLIWSFVVNNYLMGKEPFPFDLLYWNSDSTRMPATMHSYYLKSMYRDNLLIRPGGIELLDTPINITKIETPTYILSTKEDHIAPWKSTYAATQVYDGPITFVLAQSGHIAGVVNPPSKKKYGYWMNEELPPRPDQWLEKAEFHERESWWPHWNHWASTLSGKMVEARQPGSKHYPPIEDAPGAYVRVSL